MTYRNRRTGTLVTDVLLAEQEPQAPNYIAPDPDFKYPSTWNEEISS